VNALKWTLLPFVIAYTFIISFARELRFSIRLALLHAREEIESARKADWSALLKRQIEQKK